MRHQSPTAFAIAVLVTISGSVCSGTERIAEYVPVKAALSADPGATSEVLAPSSQLGELPTPSRPSAPPEAASPGRAHGASSGPWLGQAVYYDLRVVARENSDGIIDIYPETSINDNGLVALLATRINPTSGDVVPNVFVGNGTIGSLRSISSAIVGTYDEELGEGVQINNGGAVVTRIIGYQSTPFGPEPESAIRVYNAFVDNAWYDIAIGQPLGAEFDGMFGYPSISNIGGAVFAALDAGQTYLATSTSAGRFRVLLSSERPRPAMADDNRFVMRLGDQNGRIAILQPAFFPIENIAGAAEGFLNVGKMPGISDDGTIVAFYAELTHAAGNSLRLNPGPGIFASILESGTRRIVKVAGFGSVDTDGDRDGVCEAGENCVQASELGPQMGFAGFERDQRVGVTNLVDGSFVVAFVATPDGSGPLNPRTSAPFTFTPNRGVWTVRVDAAVPPGGVPLAVQYVATSPLPVVQEADLIDGALIGGLSLYDPIARARSIDGVTTRADRPGDHQLAIWAQTSAGDMVLRAVRADSDRDGLLDHWETTGLDVDRDGVIDLDLAAMGADPTRRDLFLELDWTADFKDSAGGGSAMRWSSPAPSLAALQHVVGVFAGAPADPYTGLGITVHIDAGEALSRGHGLNFDNGPWCGSTEVLPASTSGYVQPIDLVPGPSSATFENLKSNHLGSTTDKGAREFVFRYGLFGNRVQRNSGNPAGVGECIFRIPSGESVPGNDFVIGLGGQRNRVRRCDGCSEAEVLPEGFLESQLILHELGHTLGLRHSGSSVAALEFPPLVRELMGSQFQGAEFDPRYVSVMNYGWIYGLKEDVVAATPTSVEALVRVLPNAVPGPYANQAGQLADLSGLQAMVLLGDGQGQTRPVVASSAATLTVSPPWTVVPAVGGRTSVLYRTYGDGSRGIADYDDWSDMKLDFQSYLMPIGRSFPAVRRFHKDLSDELEEPELTEISAAFVGLDRFVPSLAVLAPSDTVVVSPGAPLALQARATDDSGVYQVVLTGDLDGDGATSSEERRVFSAVDDSTYAVSDLMLGGPAGLRLFEVSAEDVAGVTASVPLVVHLASAAPVPGRPSVFVVSAAPNPFNPHMRFDLDLPRDTLVTATIFDASGRRVRELLTAAPFTAGHHVLTWDGNDQSGRAAASGLYLYRFQTTEEHVEGKVTLLR